MSALSDEYRVECAGAPGGWTAVWVGPRDVPLPTQPNFCPWCGARLTEHRSYRLTTRATTSTGLAAAKETAEQSNQDPDFPSAQVREQPQEGDDA